jgi:nucleoside-diphosphate-sugar epimerase
MIVVTGANGLLGSHLLNQLDNSNSIRAIIKPGGSPLSIDKSNSPIIWKVADILDIDSLLDAFEGAETVIHTAALVSFNPKLKSKIFETNEVGTRNVVNACLHKGVKNLIHISSVAALGRQKGQSSIDENSKWQESELNTDYAISKYKAEVEVWRGQEEGLNVAILNPSIILAPSEINKSSAQFFKYVQDEKIFYTDGYINFTDVRDVVELIKKILNDKVYGERFIVNSGSTSFKNLFEQIAKRLNRKAPNVKAPKTILKLLAFLEELKSTLINTEPLITRQSIKLASEPFFYSNLKSTNKFGIKFRTLENTLDWCCEYYMHTYTQKK